MLVNIIPIDAIIKARETIDFDGFALQYKPVDYTLKTFETVPILSRISVYKKVLVMFISFICNTEKLCTTQRPVKL